MTRSTLIAAIRVATVVTAGGAALLGGLGVLGLVWGATTKAGPDEDLGPFIAIILGVVVLAGAAVIAGITGLVWSTLSGAADVGAVPALPRAAAWTLVAVAVLTVVALVLEPLVSGTLGDWGYLLVNALAGILTLLLAGAAALSQHRGRALVCGLVVLATGLLVVGMFALALL